MLELACIPKIVAVAGALCGLSTAEDGFEVARGAIEACAKGGEAALAFKEADQNLVRRALDRCRKRLQESYAKLLDSESRDDDRYRQTIESVFVSVDEVFDRCVPKAATIAALGLDPEKIARAIADAAVSMKYAEFAENGAGRRILIDLVTTAYGELRNNKHFMQAMEGANWAEAFKRFDFVEKAAERRHREDKIDAERRHREQMAKQDEILARVNQLLSKNAAQAVPDPARGLGEAIAAAEEGASAGDVRLQQALDLLKGNKIVEAEALFRTVAEEKAARIKRDSKDAAAAFRNLGAIAGLGDPKRALDAYLKAVELDPDDLDSVLWVGWIHLERGYLEDAETSFRRILSEARNDDQAYYQYWARLGLGGIREARGDLGIAKADYREAGAIADRLAKADAGNASWQRDLSVSYNKIGDVLVAQGNLPEALKSFRDGLAIRDRLAKADAGNAGWQRDLSVSYDRVGDVLVAQGHLPEALKSFRDGLAIADRLATADAGNASWQRDLSVSYAKLADAYRRASQPAKARESLAVGRDIIARLVAKFPDWSQWKQDLAWFDQQIAAFKK